jgi:YgiT-type zinc finger domain-containing protein
MCGSKRIEVKRVVIRLVGGESHAVEAEVCLDCGERYFTRAATEEILTFGKRRKARIAR